MQNDRKVGGLGCSDTSTLPVRAPHQPFNQLDDRRSSVLDHGRPVMTPQDQNRDGVSQFYTPTHSHHAPVGGLYWHEWGPQVASRAS